MPNKIAKIELHGNFQKMNDFNYPSGMMFRLQDQFQLDPNENIIIESSPNDLTYLISLLWLMHNESIGFEKLEDGNCKMVY